jgi:peptide deformylase
VADPTDPRVQSTIDDLLATVAEVSGAGLAAPQIFEPLALFVVTSAPSNRYPDAPYHPPMVVVNPEIVQASDEMENGWEGCLSIPGLRGLVPRHRRINVRYLNCRGELRQEELDGFPARVFQHEYDHLHGTLFIDRVASSLDLITDKEYFRMLQNQS